ncbi:penicillin-binding protein 1A [Owenweeksia hongkongensis]|uniref:penicillin-binding protein 1A n=1 Tax=Owenweeksia hongkongensis TaxID=253245 RepID=UPI003A952AF7
MNKRFLKRILITLASLFVLGVLAIVLFFYAVKWQIFGPLPSEDDLQKIRNATATVVYSADDKVLGKIFTENRTNAKVDDLPQHLLDALVATEDARFYEHEGVDERSMVRVLVKSILLQDESAGGGSTLTQQLAKNLYGRKNHGVLSMPVNKFKEIILATRLEGMYSKRQILELYLNTVPFSDNTYGIEAASNRFFSKKPKDLTVEESAVLIGMLKASTYYNPRLHPDHSMGRRNVVMHQMYRYDYLSQEEYDSLKVLPLQLEYNNVADDSKAPYFLVHVKKQAKELIESMNDANGEHYSLEADGLKIYTTLNADMQLYAEKAVKSHMSKLQSLFDRHWGNRKPWGSQVDVFDNELKRSRSYKNLVRRKLSDDSLNYYLNEKHPVQLYAPQGDTVREMSIRDSVEYYVRLLNSGFFAMQPQTGEVLSWVGGIDHRFLPYDHVLAERQAASTFKPVVYATALSQGASPCDYIENTQRVYENYEGWTPRNYDDNYGGFYSMKAALAKSVNVAAVQTIFEAGIGNVISMAHQMGISGNIPNDPSISLGTASISLYDMVRAYGVFANGGKRVEPFMITKIETAEGEVLYEKKGESRTVYVFDEEVATQMNYMLQAVVNEGTGAKLRNVYGLRNDLAGKTGTAQNYTDGWFIGYNPKLVAGAWVGASSPAVHFKTGTYGSGSAMALPIFGKFMQSVNRNPELKGYSWAGFEPLSVKQMSDFDCPDFREENVMDKFFDLFSKEEGKEIKQPKDSEKNKAEQKEKKGLFKRIFNKKD